MMALRRVRWLALSALTMFFMMPVASRADDIAPKAIPIWTGQAPGATGTSNEDIPAVYPYLPEPGKSTGASVLVCPGGGNQTRCIDYEGVLIAQWFKERGIAAFVLRYRIGPLYNSEASVADTMRGVQWIRAHASEYKISPTRIGLIGFSAGAENGCRATFAALPGKADSDDPVEKVSSSPNWLVPVYGSAKVGQNVPLPPSFLFCTGDDGGHLTGMFTMYKSLRDAKVPAEMHFFQNGAHGVAFAQGDPTLGEWPTLLYNWIRINGFLTEEPRVAMRGVVKVDGEPLPKGLITLIPVDKVGAPATAGYVFNMSPNLERGTYTIATKEGPVAGKYKVEVRQDAVNWLSNNVNPMAKKFGQYRNGTEAQKKVIADYARSRNLEPTIENQRIFRNVHPSDGKEIFVDIPAGKSFTYNIEVFSH